MYLIGRENKRKKSELMSFRFSDSIFVFRNRPCFSRLCLLWCLFCCVLTAILIGTLIATLVLLFTSSTKTTTTSKLMYPLSSLFDLVFFIQNIPKIRNPYCCYREGGSKNKKKTIFCCLYHQCHFFLLIKPPNIFL